MKKSEKGHVIEELKEKFSTSDFFYIGDTSGLTVAKINAFRKVCYAKGIEVKVVKNSLAVKALEEFGDTRNFTPLIQALKGPTTLMFTETANLPAKVIKEFRNKDTKPFIKAAFIGEGVYLGDDKIDQLAALKSREELLGEIISLLQSPAKNVVSALKSGGAKLAGIVKTLEERAN